MNEADLVMLADHATASQVERIVSACRGVLSANEEVERANRQVAEQYLRYDWEADGSLVVHARMPSDVGAQFTVRSRRIPTRPTTPAS
jgi:3,4-dihydroxy-2-butanone 4-phosphate synthase